jgi:AraC-like DNA-binding protein
MRFILPKSLEEGLIEDTLYPPDTSSFVMPHAVTNVRYGSFGSIVVQEERDEEFTLRLIFFDIDQPVEISVLVEEPAAVLVYTTVGDSPITLNTDNEELIRQGAYYMLYAPGGQFPVQLEAGGYFIIQVELSQQLLDRLAYKHFVMFEVTQSINERDPVGLLQGPYPINRRVKETLDKLLHCDLEDAERSLYQEARVLDLLLLFVEDIRAGKFEKAPGNFNFTADDIKAIKEAGELKVEQAGDDLRLKDVARKINLHPKKLQAGFKLVFNRGTRAFTSEARIEKAKVLLRESDMSIAEIAYETGYANDSSFIRAFKREVGVTPAAYRK